MAVKEKPGVMIYFKTGEAIKGLDYETKGRLLDCILEYGQFGKVPELSGVLAVAWPFIKQRIDDDSERYREIQDKRAKAGSRGGQAKASNAKQTVANIASATEVIAKDSTENQNYPNTHPNTHPDTYPESYTENCIVGAESRLTTTRQRFKPPSVEDVRVYAIEKGLTINPEAFVDYYTANGWKVGKNPMRDWKAAVRTWTRKDKENGRTSDCNRDTGTLEKPSIKLRAEYEL